jgi:hypothetical protein
MRSASSHKGLTEWLWLVIISLIRPSTFYAQIQISQNPITGDCRLSPDSLRPLVPLFWPYMYRYEWKPQTKTEVVWLSPERRLTIEQRACLRHHITYELRIPQTYPLNGGFTKGLMMMLDTVLTRLHDGDPAFLRLKGTIFPRLLDQLQMRALGEVAMVPYQEWNFLAQVDTDKGGAYIRLETIRYISMQAIQRPGVPDYMDDGWHR